MNPARLAWKKAYRLRRIYLRETTRAMTDALLYGTGVVHVSLDHEAMVKHVPAQEVFWWVDECATISQNTWDELKTWVKK